MDEDRIEELGHTPILPLLEQIDALADLPGLATFLGAFERRGGGGFFGSFVDSDDRNSDRYVVNVLQGGIGLPDETYYREEKFAEIREKYVAYLERILTLAERPDPAGTAAKVLALETRLAKGHWERAETRDVLKTYNLTTLEDLKATVPSFDFDAWITALGGTEATIAETVSGSRRTSPTSRRCWPTPRSRTGARSSPCGRSAPPRRTSRARSSRPTSTSTAAPCPAPPSCAPGGSAASAWWRARSVRPSGASTSPGTSRRAPRR